MQIHVRTLGRACVLACVLACGLALAARVAVAQAVYTAKGPGSFIAVGGGVSLFQLDYGQSKVGGTVSYADVNPTWRYGLEFEFRNLKYHTDEQVTESNYLVGPRVAIRGGNLRPYAKFLVGMGKITLPFNYAHGSYLEYAPGGGIDWLVGDRMIVRVIDFEYQIWPQFTYGQLTPYGISAGVSFRLNGMRRIPRR